MLACQPLDRVLSPSLRLPVPPESRAVAAAVRVYLGAVADAPAGEVAAGPSARPPARPLLLTLWSLFLAPLPPMPRLSPLPLLPLLLSLCPLHRVPPDCVHLLVLSLALARLLLTLPPQFPRSARLLVAGRPCPP